MAFIDNVTIIAASWLNRIDTAIASAGTWVIDKASGSGIKVDTASPTYGWRDIEGIVIPDQGGANAPTLAAYIGGSCRRYFFSAGDKVDCEFHIPHDYVPGTDLFLHYHWSHNGTGISGSQIVTMAYTYSKGHNQTGNVYTAEKSIQLPNLFLNITDFPRYGHFITEGQITIAGGSATQIDNALIEVDGVLSVNLTQTTAATVTGGSPNEPCIFCIDLHYQSSNIGTKNKSPNPTFYS
jgi:hypothetical protein